MYQELLGSRTNPNGAKISVTFFVAHEYNDYNLTHQLYREGLQLYLPSNHTLQVLIVEYSK